MLGSVCVVNSVCVSGSVGVCVSEYMVGYAYMFLHVCVRVNFCCVYVEPAGECECLGACMCLFV